MHSHIIYSNLFENIFINNKILFNIDIIIDFNKLKKTNLVKLSELIFYIIKINYVLQFLQTAFLIEIKVEYI